MTESRARPPARLPADARALLARYREAEDIPGDAKERIWSVVGDEDAPAPRFDPLAPREAEPSRARVRVLGWVGFAFASAAAIALAWRLGGVRAEHAQPQASPSAAPMQGGRESDGGVTAPRSHRAGVRSTDPSRASDSTDPSRASDSTDREPTETETAASESTAASSSGSRSAVAPALRATRPVASDRTSTSAPRWPAITPSPSEETSSMAAERELVARAWRSLAHGDETAALAATAEHRQRFPEGLLGPEREAIEAIAACRTNPARRESIAASFHRAHPRSVLAERIDEACDTRADDR